MGIAVALSAVLDSTKVKNYIYFEWLRSATDHLKAFNLCLIKSDSGMSLSKTTNGRVVSLVVGQTW